MGSRSVVVAGLLAGVLTAAVAFAVLVAALPEGSVLPTPTPPPTLPVAVSPSPADSGAPPTAAPASPSPTASGAAAFMVGEPAPALSVAQLGGGTIDLAALRGKPVWVNFMATWCPSCRDELPRMSDLAGRYSDSGLVVIAIDVNEDEAEVAAFMVEVGATFPVGLDPEGTAQAAWQAGALPTHFWIDSAGIIRAGALGGIGPDVMAANLATILPGVDVTP